MNPRPSITDSFCADASTGIVEVEVLDFCGVLESVHHERHAGIRDYPPRQQPEVEAPSGSKVRHPRAVASNEDRSEISVHRQKPDAASQLRNGFLCTEVYVASSISKPIEKLCQIFHLSLHMKKNL